MPTVTDLFSNVKKLPALPTVLLELMESFSNDDVQVEEIAKKIGKDQAISAKVIRMANSTAFRRGKEVESIEQAVIRLGFKQVRSIVIAANLSNTFPTIEGFDIDHFWEQTFIISCIAKNLAKHTKINSETAFTCAMMHNIGELLLQTVKPDECSLVKASIESGGLRLEAQREIFGFDYTQAGTELAKHWKFSSVFYNAIEQQLDPLSYNPPSKEAVLIRLSVFSAFAWGLNLPAEMIVNRFPEPLAKAINLKKEGLVETFTQMIEEGRELGKLVSD